MTQEIKPTQLKEIKGIKHIKSADGLSYEKDKYKFNKPVQVELKSEDKQEYVRFSQPVKEITIKTSTTNTNTLLTITLTNNTQINFNSYYKNYYTLLL